MKKKYNTPEIEVVSLCIEDDMLQTSFEHDGENLNWGYGNDNDTIENWDEWLP